MDKSLARVIATDEASAMIAELRQRHGPVMFFQSGGCCDGSRAFRVGRAIQAGRVWTNCYHLYPAHAAFGGYKQSGIGRENHKMMLDHYQQTKNLLVSYSPNALGFF